MKERVRAGRRHEHDHHLVRGDEDLAEAIVDYPSVASHGWTWPGEELLAQILNERARNIRKRIARLRAAGLLIVLRPSDGWRSNRYIPVLDGRPLFEVAMASEQVREAIAALQRGERDTGTPVPPQDDRKSGTPVPPEEVGEFQAGRNASSAEPSRNNPQEGDSPTPYPAPNAAPTNLRREEETLVSQVQQAASTTPPKPWSIPYGTSDSAEQPTPPNGCPTDHEPDVRAQPAAERAPAPVVEFSFACLVRDYPHPPGAHGVGHPAYLPHARGVWGKLTTEQKRAAVRAAPHSPGKEWLGHWLDNGRETGKFQMTDLPAVVPRVWVRKDTPQWTAWTDCHRASGRCLPTTQHRIDGELLTGWFFETEWPLGIENVKGYRGTR